MSVRVNLLPEATKQRGRASRQRAIAGVAGVVFLLLLGGVYWWFANQVSNAEDELAAEQAISAELRAEEAELVAFVELADRRDRADEVLSAAMASEVSLAAVLQDLAAVTPSDTQFDSIAVQLQGAEGSAGTFNLSGRTLTSHAPGVERVLLSLEKITTFKDLYLNSSSLSGEDVEEGDEEAGSIASFSVDGNIGPEARTGRYQDGLPEDLR
ncbi:MAG: hypothetical protein WD638_04625 [Nitriliruptoraceae bacterium]